MRLQGGRMKSVTTAGRCARVIIACGLALAAAGCGDSTPVGIAGPTTGVLQVTVSTSGADIPANGYTVSVDSGAGQAVTVNGALTISGLKAGTHSVTLYSVAANCTLSGANTRAVEVIAGDTVPVAFAVGCTVTGEASGQIAFASNRDGNYDIYVRYVNALGSPTRLTNNPAIDVQPAWSPDRAKIAFASNRDGNFEIYVIGADGSHPTRLTNTAADDYDPAWSPDGGRIAFVSSCPSGLFADGHGSSIHVMNADGSNSVLLVGGLILARTPSWSSDGSAIAFAGTGGCNYSDEDGCHWWWPYGIDVVRADGTSVPSAVPAQLVPYDDNSNAVDPSWRP